METTQIYLRRKHRELRLINDCLGQPVQLACPQSIPDVVRLKFQLTAALKAEHARHDWAVTETAWAHSGRRRIGPFEFSYDYQRADLDVHGPSFYELGDRNTAETIYTTSGMSAISALLLAAAQIVGHADILLLPGSYGETQELIESLVSRLRLVTVRTTPLEARGRTSSPRILLLDSCAPAAAFHATLRATGPAVDLLIFDTTGLCCGSGRIQRALAWARTWHIPAVMVRSHTKLDSLGAEYGRLGSAVFVHQAEDASRATGSTFEDLPSATRNAVRLLGGAALPAHFPPYVGTPAYRELTNQRVAAMLRNSRRAGRYFASALPGLTAELHFAHGLYLTLNRRRPLDEASARHAAAEMSDDLGRAGLPIRHAGSFGFDFAATEWFQNSTTGRYSVRVAVPDLPTALWDDVAQAIAQWWSAHEGKSAAA